MIKTVKTIQEEIEQFNSQQKYIENCDFCRNQILYTQDELQNNIIKCPYCGHTQKIRFKQEYNIKLNISNQRYVDEFDDDSYKV